MDNNRKIELFENLLFYIREIVHDRDEVFLVLLNLGFTEEEIQHYREIGEL